jgi:aspartate racemase
VNTIGLVGGLGPESTIDYYRRIIEGWEKHHPSSAPRIVIDSLDYRIALNLVQHDRAALIQYFSESLERLAAANASFAAITANTPHIVFDELASRSPIPVLSIVEACADECRRLGLKHLALLGTRFTMDAAFFADVFQRKGMTVISPVEPDRAWIHDRYVNQLLIGEFRDETRQEFVSLIERLRRTEGIDGVILGGTELPLLLQSPVIAGLPMLDTTALHVDAIVREAAEGTS